MMREAGEEINLTILLHQQMQMCKIGIIIATRLGKKVVNEHSYLQLDSITLQRVRMGSINTLIISKYNKFNHSVIVTLQSLLNFCLILSSLNKERLC